MSEINDMSALVGEEIGGRYRLQQMLDQGAFGAVYRATQMAYGVALREVAVKVAKRPLSESEAKRIFGDALMMSRVADSTSDMNLRQHFVTVFDAGYCDDGGQLKGHPYVAMELVRGGSLTKQLRDGPFPLQRAIAAFDQILRAVAFMHQDRDGYVQRKRIVHRDLKPGNILVHCAPDGNDVYKITDFGLAVEVKTLLGWVASGGDLSYLPAESFARHICSTQSDVYMLGMVFYEMVIGSNPFHQIGRHLRGDDEAKQQEISRLHLQARHLERFALLESHGELSAAPALQKVIQTALANDVTERTYQHAGEMLAAWQHAATTQATNGDSQKMPWHRVAKMSDEAMQAFGVGDDGRGWTLLNTAMTINRDTSQMPDAMAVGKAYLLMVEQLVKRDDVQEAKVLANEGFQRRKCRSTYLAMSIVYEKSNAMTLAQNMNEKSRMCDDQT